MRRGAKYKPTLTTYAGCSDPSPLPPPFLNAPCEQQCGNLLSTLTLSAELLMNGAERKVQAVRNSQLFEDVVHVVLHRLLAEEHFLGQFLVPETPCDVRHDLALPPAEG